MESFAAPEHPIPTGTSLTQRTPSTPMSWAAGQGRACIDSHDGRRCLRGGNRRGTMRYEHCRRDHLQATRAEPRIRKCSSPSHRTPPLPCIQHLELPQEDFKPPSLTKLGLPCNTPGCVEVLRKVHCSASAQQQHHPISSRAISVLVRAKSRPGCIRATTHHACALQ
jgi:hypothetical protein